MTNKDKYLKDGVDSYKLYEEFDNFCLREMVRHDKGSFKAFMGQSAKLTLTEDEKVILRNIEQCEYQKIARKTGALFLIGDNVYGKRDTSYMFGTIFKSSLFKFIKERRRI